LRSQYRLSSDFELIFQGNFFRMPAKMLRKSIFKTVKRLFFSWKIFSQYLGKSATLW
jgi:hypothetical protein